MRYHPGLKRRDIDGRPLPRPYTVKTYCGICGMPLAAAREFHPLEACKAYQRSDAERALRAIQGMRP